MGILNIGSTLNTGTYYGNGYVSGSSYGYAGNAQPRQASVASLNNMSRTGATAYSSKYNQINAYLQQGETQKALDLWNTLKEEIKLSYASTNNNWYVDDSTIESMMEAGFFATTGQTFEVAGKLDGEFKNHFIKALGFGIGSLFTSDYSQEEYLAEKTGTEVSTKAKIKGAAGAALGGAATGAAIGTLIGGPGVGTLVGAGIGAAVGLAEKFFGL